MAEPPRTADAEVLSPTLSAIAGMAWLVLFAGRWIAVPFLLAARVLTPATVADIDQHILVRLYLVLLALTIVVAILRTMRSARTAKGPDRPNL